MYSSVDRPTLATAHHESVDVTSASLGVLTWWVILMKNNNPTLLRQLGQPLHRLIAVAGEEVGLRDGDNGTIRVGVGDPLQMPRNGV